MNLLATRTLLGLATVLAVGLADISAEACSCIPPDLVSSYNNSTDVIRARVLRERVRGQEVYYVVRVQTTYKGCLRHGQRALVVTAASGATCGMRLQVGENYLLTAYRQGRRLSINLCGYNRLFSSLTPENIQFLDTRYNCCNGQCACVNSPMVYCFADPCQVNSCPEGECTANYCGGCWAEFYNEMGQAVCNRCETDDDCSWNQHCSAEGQCLTNCWDDSQCAEGNWCRPTQQEYSECVPFQQEGEWCGGFTPIWAQARCAPGLICTDFPPFIADAPGRCRVPCKETKDCSEGQYCAYGDVCRDGGACNLDVDCNHPDNAYVHIECVGYGECHAGECGWTCGNPQCLDLEGIDFGPCEAILGWGVIRDQCTMISGCGDQGFNLFATQAECQRACMRSIEPIEAVELQRMTP